MEIRILKKYNKDFKLRAVKLCFNSSKHGAEIARDLGVHQTTLSSWKQKYLNNQKQAFSDPKGSDEFVKEIKALKKELIIAKEERDILKKAAIDSIDQRNTLYYDIKIINNMGNTFNETNGSSRHVSWTKSEVWRLWRKGESLSDIGRAVGKYPGSVFGIFKLKGGITPSVRQRSH